MPDLKIHHHLAELSPTQWDALRGTDNPFISYAFLAALEQTGCVGLNTGWRPLHLALYEEQQLLAAMPLYLKAHPWGEYVFDWSWQEAWEEAGQHYYPKLVTAVPFTPVTGPRVLYDKEKLTLANALDAFIPVIKQLCSDNDFSGWHGLFVDPKAVNAYQAHALLPRLGMQYHWFNHNYTDFADFLATFTSRKRKNLRKERAQLAAQALQFTAYSGADITREHIDIFYPFYQDTYLRHGQQGYLSKAFFYQLQKTIPDHLLLILAYQHHEPIAGALFFKDSQRLYGRYWGCKYELPLLHFETCYYQGIEYCIKHGLTHFDPGAQGEHKIQRGFEPIATWSVHWLDNASFHEAVAQFLKEEHSQMEQQMAFLKSYLPYRQSTSGQQ